MLVVTQSGNDARCLIIGFDKGIRDAAQDSEAEPRAMSYRSFCRTTPDLTNIDIVVSPLFGAGFDAFDVLERLRKLGFRAMLRVLAPRLPDRHLVSQELSKTAADCGITVELVVIQQST
jgi:hypothetical protein